MVGPLSKTQTSKEFILVATNYITKWVEAMTTSSIKAKDVVQFIYHNICIRFGVLCETVWEWSIIYNKLRGGRSIMIKRQEKIFCLKQSLKLLYDNHLDKIKGQKTMTHWEVPFVVHD